MDQALQDPNRYELSPDDRIVSYSTSSIAGQRIRMSQGEEVSVSTFGVLTTTSTPVAGPPPGVGQTYEVIMLDGTAQIVQS